MKQKMIFAFRSICFVLVFLLLLTLSAQVFCPKGNGPEDGIHDHKQRSFLGEREDSIDVVVVGNSLGQCGFSPLDIWENYGITVQVCASGNQKLYQSYDFLKELLDYHSPRMVILEAHAIMITSTMQERVQRQVENWFPAVRYHDRWKQLRVEDVFGPTSYTYTDDLKGYHYESIAEPARAQGYMEPSGDIEPIWDQNRKYMDQITRLCRDNGIQLILVSVPSIQCWDYPQHNAVESLARELDIPYWDLNLEWEAIGIDWSTDTYDWGNHMNYSGSRKVSANVGQYLADAGLFTDKRGLAEYESWNEALARFRRSIETGAPIQ